MRARLFPSDGWVAEWSNALVLKTRVGQPTVSSNLTPSANMKTALVFDLWETLGTKNVGISKSLQQRFSIPKAEDFLHKYEKAVQLKKWENEEDMARNFLVEFGVTQNDENTQFVVELFRKGINNATLFDGMKELLITLKQKGYKLGLLSNTTVFESGVLERLSIDNFFDAKVFSWQKGNLKPSQEAFEQILYELGAPKDEVLFIDDTQKNIIAAEQYGISSIKFESVPKLKEDIIKLGLFQ